MNLIELLADEELLKALAQEARKDGIAENNISAAVLHELVKIANGKRTL